MRTTPRSGGRTSTGSSRFKHRHQLFAGLDNLRTLRNRIAHHEPIFQRRLSADYHQVLVIVGAVSSQAKASVEHHSRVPALLASTPETLGSF